MTSSRIGNNKAVLSQTINSSFFKNTLLNVRLKTAYFRFVPSDGTFFVVSGTVKKTVIQNENAAAWESCPRLFGIGLLWSGSPEIHPRPPFRKPVVLLNTFGWLQQRGKQPQNNGILFRELRPPFPEQGHTQSGLRADIPRGHRGY